MFSFWNKSHIYQEAQELRPQSPLPQDVQTRAEASNAEAQEIGSSKLSCDDIIIAVMGPTGTGKTSFINKATGRKDGIGHSLRSETHTITPIHFHIPEQSNLDVIFIDTPGFDDTYLSDMETLENIATWLKKTYENNVKLAGIIYVHRITDNRMGATPLRNLHVFEKLCGPDALRNVILMTTMWDEMPNSSGPAREAELKDKYWKGMLAKGSTVVRFEGTRESAWAITAPFLEQANTRYATLLQEELVGSKKQLEQTQAGIELYSALLRLVSDQQKVMRRLRKTILSSSEMDPTTTADILEYEQICGRTAQVVGELKKMNIPLGARIRHYFTFRRGVLDARV